ncbi:hypothetical protein HYU22_02725 [Candidatus Woesearchaeota archaeon]|nr:hypothetical protein [Candidatus Woesearchaeota archaeon]
MLKMKKVSEVYDLKVFTDAGDYFGDIEDCIVQGNKVSGWKIKATKNSFLSGVSSPWETSLSSPRAPCPVARWMRARNEF